MLKFRLGAGTIVTVLAALLIGGYGVYQQRKAAAQPPVVERTVQGTAPRGIAPVPEFLLRHQADLQLTAAQVKRLHAIAAAYRKDIAPYQQQATTVAADYQQQIERAKAEKRPSLQEIQRAGGDIQKISNTLVMTRHAYWQQARTVLTTQQRARADGLVAKSTLQDLR
jgi:hypothetical protein